jgi:hypothetical protein
MSIVVRLKVKVINAGIEIIISKKSNLFQFDLKYCLKPKDFNLTKSSRIKSEVIELSTIENKNLSY